VPASRSIQLARLFGIRIGASPSWFVVLFLIIFYLSGQFGDVLEGASQTTAYLVAVVAAFLFFVSLVAHELGHALVARRGGIAVEGIDLWFFGGLAKLSRDTRSPGEELRVAGAGPLVTAVIAAAAYAGTRALDGGAGSTVLGDEGTTPAAAVLGWLAFINIALLVFNLVPAFPLDGGRLARAAAWKATGDRAKGTVFSARLGQAFGVGLIGFGAYLLLTDRTVDGLWLGVLGWFLLQAASGAVGSSRVQQRLSTVRVTDVMDREPVAIPAATPAREADDAWVARWGHPWFCVVEEDGRLAGVVEADAVRGAAPETPVRALAGPAEAVDTDASMEDLLASESLRRRGGLPVVDGAGRLEGVVTADQVRRALSAAVVA
jgi:Zn-dependent protease